MKKNDHIKNIQIITLLLVAVSIISCSRPNGALIGDNTVIFYPEKFEKERMLPSFALLVEPSETGKLPVNWKIIPQFSKKDGKNYTLIHLEDSTDLYGTGEIAGNLRNNGKTVTLWNTDNFAYAKDEGRRLYQTHPWILGVRKDGTAFGILSDNTWKQEIIFGNPIEIISDGPAARVIVIDKKSPEDVVKALGDLTGKIELPPLWALGYQQCRYSYYPDSRVKEIANEFRKRKIPCDVIWMDIHYMQDYKVFTFDSVRFPDPAGTNNYLHENNFKSVWMIDPGIKKEQGYFVYEQGSEGNHWVLTKDDTEYNGEVWPGMCVFPDFTRPETRKWWSGLYKDFMQTGIDGVWNDMNEPAVFNTEEGTMPIDNKHRGGGNLPADIHLRYHNVYGMLMVKASREGILETNPDKRPFVLSRANYLGGQRYAATWTGDNVSSWEHLKMSTPMVLNLGLSGQPFSGPDIGGFSGDANAELLAHWMAIGAFYPFCRNHTTDGSADQEPWAFGKNTENVSRLALERRYRLLPYLYTLFYEASIKGLPVARPVFMLDPLNKNLRDQDEIFAWGDDLLIIPKWAENTILPSGNWQTITIINSLETNDKYQPELKQRAGSIIPLGKLVQSTEEFENDSVTLMVCLDEKAEASGYMYSDDGEGFGYKNGLYAITTFQATPKNDSTITITCRNREGNSPLKDANFRACIVNESGYHYSDWNNTGRIEVIYK